VLCGIVFKDKNVFFQGWIRSSHIKAPIFRVSVQRFHWYETSRVS
jgi:hypothetical protein